MNTRAVDRLSLFGYVVICVMLGVAPAAGQEVVDQSNEVGDTVRAEDFFEPVGQSFTPTLNLIDFVELKLSDISTAFSSHSVRVNIRDAAIDGPILGSSSTVILPDCFNQAGGPGCRIAGGFPVEVHLDFPAAVPLTPGIRHVIEIVTTGDVGVLHQSRGNPYAGGTAIFDGIPHLDRDLWFREGATIPEPSAVSLWIAALTAVLTPRTRDGSSRARTRPTSPNRIEHVNRPQ